MWFSKLQKEDYEGNGSRSSENETSLYDQLYYFIVDENGEKVKNIKSYYEASTSEIYTEGLHKGDYRLLVLGIKGNAAEDKKSATFFKDLPSMITNKSKLPDIR